MFQCVLESDNRMFGPGSRSHVVKKTSFSQALQIRGNRAFPGGQARSVHEVHAERLCTAKKKKSSARHRTRQPNNVYLQPVSTDTSNQTQGPLHAFALYVAGVLDMMVHGDEARHDACMSTGNEFGSHVGQLYYIQFNE
jgi:hypothetical protein